MAKPEWGIKRICPACGLKYYDFNNSPIACPSCKVEFDPDIYLKSRKGKSLSTKTVADNNDGVSSLDDIEVANDEEVVSDDDPILEIKREEKNEDNEGDNSVSDDINFIEDTDITDEDITSVEIIEEQKD
jgi:uncharacterized protein (TIGR02300 family)